MNKKAIIKQLIGLKQYGLSKKLIYGLGILFSLMSLFACSSNIVKSYALGLPNIEANQSKSVANTQKVLLVNAINVDAMLNGKSIYYQRQKGQFESFTESEWVTQPANMLQTLFVEALEKTNGFKGVIAMPSAIEGTHRLDLSLIKLNLLYTKEISQAQLAFRAQLVDLASGKLLYSKTYENQQDIIKKDARSGIDALNLALANVAPQILNDVLQTNPSRP